MSCCTYIYHYSPGVELIFTLAWPAVTRKGGRLSQRIHQRPLFQEAGNNSREVYHLVVILIARLELIRAHPSTDPLRSSASLLPVPCLDQFPRYTLSGRPRIAVSSDEAESIDLELHNLPVVVAVNDQGTRVPCPRCAESVHFQGPTSLIGRFSWNLRITLTGPNPSGREKLGSSFNS